MMGDPADWLVGGGEMAKVIKAKDWSTTPLGPIARWPQSLRTTVSLVQASSSPISLAWGSAHTQIYNDGYWPICGAKHPHSMGQGFRECWASAFPVIGEAYATAWSGRSAYLEKMRMFLDRYGFLEETWFTFSFSPITDESGRVGGLFHPVTEMTGQMLSERRTQTVRDLAIGAASSRSREEALQLSAEVFAHANLDVPFALFYLVDDSGSCARRIAEAGMSRDAAGPALVSLDSGWSPWALADAYRSGEVIEIDNVAARIADPVGPYPEIPRRALVLPIRRAGHGSVEALLVAGVSARLTLTDAYRVFFELVASAVGTALANAHALENERAKAASLAELDRAKTAFFSNVSHEFRTPLTLILGPLEDELADRSGLSTPRRERLETMHRNSLRLLRLVNSLLDFSRIEASRLCASFEPVDLAVETSQLAAVFRSAIEKAGLTLTVRCAALPEPVYIDREMWEKIVLNLLSNAVKHTASGGITVALDREEDSVRLRVLDTGIGIAEHELPHVFERFHRVQGAWSRSHEGTGIGLALVRELVRALAGEVKIASTVDVGTTVTVTLKAGCAHLPADQVRGATTRAPNRASAAYVDEALHWTPGVVGPATHVQPLRADAPSIIWADDNADMREYVLRLLSDQFAVLPVANGLQALRAVHERLPELPDLVLSDVMMPELDGFGLLAALRSDPRTQMIPVVLVSARAGAEAAIEGMDAGADDYLIKPFAARELIARVRTHVELGRTRRGWAAELARTNAVLANTNAELARTNADLVRANQQLSRSNTELEAFSYSVSHDLRSPLRAIDAFTQILLEESLDLDTSRRNLLQKVKTNGQRMRTIIDDLLSLARVGKAELRREPVDLTAIARRVVRDLRQRDPARLVEVDVSDGMVTQADGRLIAIALENLLSNAWKFTSKRSPAEIVIGCEDGSVFAVRDNGAGFDMTQSAQLFEPFQRLHASEEFEGTGIGLSIVRRIVERHGGQVWAQGETGRGATVRFTLGSAQ
ncbi:MAG TPA: ATP-binding protein [Kofleriaceae bacterium]|nr:ATP-binding protein [Kofleriaceae bacterium]